MTTYWERNEAYSKNYYIQITDNQYVSIWEDTGKNPHTEAGAQANFKEFLETDFYKNLVRDNMGEEILNEVINAVKQIQNSSK